MTEGQLRSTSRIPKIVIGVGALLLLLSAAGYFGNFWQWNDAVKATARILDGKQQWVRRGAGSINLSILYSVQDGERPGPRQGTVSLTESTLEEARTGEQIQVYYMKGKPDRVIPVLVLEKKQRDVTVGAVAGAVITIVGLLLQFRRRSSAPAAR